MSEESFFEELILCQRKKLMKLAEKLVGKITEEDLLQPNDFPALESNPIFRYEEGVLEGLMTARMAYLAKMKDLLE